MEVTGQARRKAYLTTPANRALWRLVTGRMLLAAVATSCAMGQAQITVHDESSRAFQERARTLHVCPPIWPEKRVVDTVLTQGVTYRQSAPRTLTIDGRKYIADAAIPVLMSVLLDEEKAIEDRARSLRTLGRIASQLVESQWIPKLVDYAEQCENPDLKLLTVQILAGSLDRRGLPLLSKLLSGEQDAILRFSLAGPLAAWNVRDGVRGLVELLDSTLKLSEDRPLWSPVLQGLEELNDIKAWGFPMAQVKKAMDQIGDGQVRLVLQR